MSLIASTWSGACAWMDRNCSARLKKGSDVALAILVVGIVVLMVVRVSPAVMDYLIAANLAAGVTILLTALYVGDAIRLPSFPSILLVTTLFRLALSISATRLILLEAHAGDVIATFGEFVVGGNFVIGILVFFVLLIVQFVVIAQGADRVAGVSARFFIDLMQGKQHAIEADLNAKTIGKDEAARRRRRVEREARLYGAMDGAMKFVKGDAIASFVIAAVNIAGGLVVGVMQLDMPIGEAAATFTLLTVGEGLVSQIPALLVSTAAGIVVTRVQGNDEERSEALGSDLFGQVLDNPRALLIGGLFFVLIGAITVPLGVGFPPLPFLLFGSALLALAAAGWKRAPAAAAAGPASTEARAATDSAAAEAGPSPLVLHVGSALAAEFAPGADGRPARAGEFLERIETAVRRDMVAALPRLDVRPSASLGPAEYVLAAHEAYIARGSFAGERVLLVADPALLRQQGLEGEEALLPGFPVRGLSVARQEYASKHALASRHAALDAHSQLSIHLIAALRRHAHVFIGIQETRRMIERLEARSKDLVGEVLTAKKSDLAGIADVLRHLVREQMPIPGLRCVMEVLARVGAQEKRPAVLAELVRNEARNSLHVQLIGSNRIMELYELAVDAEQKLGNAALRGHFKPGEAEQFVQAVERCIPVRKLIGWADVSKSARRTPAPAIVVGDVASRQALRLALQHDFPDVVVLTRGEVPVDVLPITLDRIGLEAA